MHFAELACAARLLFVAVVGLRHLGDGLAVGNLRRDIVVLEAILLFDARAEDIEMMLALTLYDGLFQLLGVFDQNRRVLEFGVVEHLAQLLLVALLLGLDGGAVARFGEYDRFDGHRRRRRRERVVGARALEFDGATDVARHEFGDFDAVPARYGEELRHLLLVARAGVHQLGALGDTAADHAEIGDLADMLFDLTLEYESHGGRRLVGRDLFAVGREEVRGLQRAGSDVDDELHQTLGADVALAAGAEDRHHLAFREADFQTRADVVLRERALVEVQLHEGFVVFGGHLDQLLVQLLSLVQLFGGNFQLLAVAVVVLETVHLHQQYVDEGVEFGTLIDRVLHDDGLHARRGADRLDGGLEIGLVGVELVHYADHGFLQQTGVAGLNFAADLPAVLGVEQEYAHVAHLERREETSAEVVRAGAVDDVQLAVHEFGEEDGRIDRALVFMLDIRVVRERVVRLDTTPAVDDLTLEGHRFGKGSFPRAGRADEYDVLDLFS